MNLKAQEYDYTNIFREIIDEKTPAKVFKDSSHTLVIYDIAPRFKTHLLVIPKGSYTNFHDMMQKATQEEILDFFETINSVISETKIFKGYQLFTNTSKTHGQEVMHFHMHLVSQYGL